MWVAVMLLASTRSCFGFQPQDLPELQSAVDAWCGGDTTTYGLINEWDVSLMTSLTGIFTSGSSPSCGVDGGECICGSFNDDISAWDTR